jgi:hypothetical protein
MLPDLRPSIPLRTLVETWPPAQNGYGVLTDAPAVLTQVKEAHTALTVALETLQKTQWPVREIARLTARRRRSGRTQGDVDARALDNRTFPRYTRTNSKALAHVGRNYLCITRN